MITLNLCHHLTITSIKKILFRTFMIKMIQNEVILDDTLFNIFSDPEPIYFRSIESIEEVSRNRIETHIGSIAINIELDTKVHQYRRSVLTFLEVTGINNLY